MNWIINIASSSALSKATDLEEELGKLGIVRIFLGFFISYRVIQLLNVSQYYFDTSEAYNLGLWFLLLSVMFMIGLFTPIVTALILFFWHRLDTAMSTFTLGSSILMLTIAVYFFINAGGLKYSVDAYLLKKNGAISNFIKKTYNILGTPTLEIVHTVYFLALFTYALISLGAIIWHFQDPSWVGGTTVIELMGNSFLCKYYETFRQVHIAMPEIFKLFSQFSIVGQSIFQLLMIPLMFNRFGLVYVKFWGVGFFLVSLFIIQLGYLPHIELLLWFLIFYRKNEKEAVTIIYDDYCNLCKNAVRFLKRVNFNKAYTFTPLSTNMNVLEEKGLKREELQSEMHGFIDDELFVGYDLYLKLTWANPLLIATWPLLLLGKHTKIGYFVYRHVAKNRHKYFGTCEVAFNVNNEIENPFVPRDQSKMFFDVGMSAIIVIYIVFITFQFPFVREKTTLRYFHSIDKKHTFKSVVKWLNRTPFVMPLVFNKTDLMMGDRWAVLYRNVNGKKELVPITNPNGSRANYEEFDWFFYSNHNSDILYFGNTVTYRRAFIGKDPKVYHQQGTYGFTMLENRIKFDYRKTGQKGKVTYTIEVYQNKNSADLMKPSYDHEMIMSFDLDIAL